MRLALRFTLWISSLAGAFLAFGWPVLVSADPASASFRWVATATVVVFLLALAGVCIDRAMASKGR